MYTFGPLIPEGENVAAGEQKQSEKGVEISQFLQKTLETDGPGSMLYVSTDTVALWDLEKPDIRVINRSLSALFSGRRSQRRSGLLLISSWRRTSPL